LVLVPNIALESLIIAVIAYIVSLSMALIFAQKNKYEIDPNQELLAQVRKMRRLIIIWVPIFI